VRHGIVVFLSDKLTAESSPIYADWIDLPLGHASQGRWFNLKLIENQLRSCLTRRTLIMSNKRINYVIIAFLVKNFVANGALSDKL
jgi:hypothetical protein